MYVDGNGDPPYATSYDATVTLASGGQTLSKTVTVPCSLWGRVSVEVSAWPYRDHVSGISVSRKGAPTRAGATPWYSHFQSDDVGYTALTRARGSSGSYPWG
jgi:hypothetical protein